jgi:predicted O-methyltransferase YrrM
MQATVDITRAQSIIGWMSDRELMWLASLAQKYQYIVEFGSFHGRSTRALADNLRADGKLWAVDTWNGEKIGMVNTYSMPLFKRNLKDHIDSGKVIPCRQFSYLFKPPHLVDVVFIDSDHHKEYVERDIKNAISILKSSGMLCGHDYGGDAGWPDVKEVVDEKFGKVGVEDTIWFTQKY